MSKKRIEWPDAKVLHHAIARQIAEVVTSKGGRRVKGLISTIPTLFAEIPTIVTGEPWMGMLVCERCRTMQLFPEPPKGMGKILMEPTTIEYAFYVRSWLMSVSQEHMRCKKVKEKKENEREK